ncbi:helix-turn-helix domain-containing protein [Nocardia sp. NPDC004718]
MPIARIAESVGWSHKHLITKFTQQVGLSPKTAARIIRFDRVRSLLRQNPHPPLHQIAADCGYADHSHLDRDFRSFSSFTPSGYIAHIRGPLNESFHPHNFKEESISSRRSPKPHPKPSVSCQIR